MKQFNPLPFLRDDPSTNPLFLSNFFMTPIVVQISKRRYPLILRGKETMFALESADCLTKTSCFLCSFFVNSCLGIRFIILSPKTNKTRLFNSNQTDFLEATYRSYCHHYCKNYLWFFCKVFFNYGVNVTFIIVAYAIGYFCKYSFSISSSKAWTSFDVSLFCIVVPCFNKSVLFKRVLMHHFSPLVYLRQGPCTNDVHINDVKRVIGLEICHVFIIALNNISIVQFCGTRL